MHYTDEREAYYTEDMPNKKLNTLNVTFETDMTYLRVFKNGELAHIIPKKLLMVTNISDYNNMIGSLLSLMVADLIVD